MATQQWIRHELCIELIEGLADALKYKGQSKDCNCPACKAIRSARGVLENARLEVSLSSAQITGAPPSLRECVQGALALGQIPDDEWAEVEKAMVTAGLVISSEAARFCNSYLNRALEAEKALSDISAPHVDMYVCRHCGGRLSLHGAHCITRSGMVTEADLTDWILDHACDDQPAHLIAHAFLQDFAVSRK